MSYGQITPDLAADPNVIPLPDPTTLAGQAVIPQPGPPQVPPDVSTLPSRTAPAVIPNALPIGRFQLTKQEAPTTEPGINPVPPNAGYMRSSVDPNTGQPTAMNPSLTKLGKLLTVLRAAGQGAMVGSTQPTVGSGFEAAQQNTNQQVDQFQRQQQASMALQSSRASMGLVDTPWGTMPRGTYNSLLGKVLPAQIAGASRENVADTAADSRQKVAQYLAGSRESIAKYNADSRAKIAGVQGVELTPEMATKYNIPQEFVGTKIKPSDYAAMTRATVFEDIPLMTAAGPIIVNRKTGQARPVEGEGGQTYQPPALASPKEVADPNSPGNTTIVPAGQSFGMQGTQSASVQVPRQAMRAEVPTKIGDQKVAFTTMVQHADLLRRAAKALNNGDMQSLSGLENAFKNEFGYSGPITAAAIADAYKGEVANVINKGHITDTGSEKIAHTLDPSKQNYETIDSVLGAYQGLAQSKMNMLNQQEQAAIDRAQAKNKKPGNNAAAPPAQAAHPPGFSPF